jgi:hypothetical protein
MRTLLKHFGFKVEVLVLVLVLVICSAMTAGCGW